MIRIVLTALMTSMLFACQPAKDNLSVEDYLYPKDSLRTAKLFSYQRVDSPEIQMAFVQHCFSKNDSTYSVKYSLEHSQRDSTLFKEVDGRFEMVERYMIFPNGPEMSFKTSKANIVEYLNDDTQTFSIIEFKEAMPEISIRIEALSKLDPLPFKYEHHGQSLNCIRYQEETTVTTSNKINPGLKRSFKTEGESIYAEGLGMISFFTRNKRNGGVESWELESIKAY